MATEGRRRREGRPRYYQRRRGCAFCADHTEVIDYKDVERLKRYLSDQVKIEGRRRSGTCAKHQRALSTAMKRARHLALLPFTAHQAQATGWVRHPAGN